MPILIGRDVFTYGIVKSSIMLPWTYCCTWIPRKQKIMFYDYFYWPILSQASFYKIKVAKICEINLELIFVQPH